MSGDKVNIPRSIRLQKKVWEVKDPETKSKQSRFYLVWFPEELKYSVIEGKTIKEVNPKAKDRVHVKDSSGTYWDAVVYSSGSKSFCKENQQKLENICQASCSEGDGTTVEEENTSEQETTIRAPSKRKGTAALETGKKKKRIAPRRIVDSEREVEELEEYTSRTCSQELDLLKEESKRVNRLLYNKENKTSSSPQVSVAQEIVSVSEDIGTDPEFDVTTRSKNPTLYETALMSYLFSDEEMRESCVQPKENGKKKALDQSKINLIKKCIRIKFSEKVLEKSWSEIRSSMNQKCSDKLKIFRKNLPTDTIRE
ncbi:uncharacterized protein [Acropora muricata]|uniref:uncharacterized protein n=1 Tax=Acropora muricata TaxID=159855 RepID=UPI0034E39814